MFQMVKSLVNKYEKERTESYIKNFISKNEKLRKIIEEVNIASNSCGVSLSDYVALYKIIKNMKPKFVLECGTGKSTWIIAQAMLENAEEGGIGDIRLVSMDHNDEWYRHQLKLLPDKFRDFVELHCSPMDIYEYSMIRGTIYKEIPDYKYEFVFNDGPFQDFQGERVMCNMQVVKVVEKSEIKVSALIDNRKHTILACSLVFGPEKVMHYKNWNLGFVDNVSKNDLILHDKVIMKKLIFPRIVNSVSGFPFQ